MEKQLTLLLAFISGVYIAHDVGYNNALKGKNMNESRKEIKEMLDKARKENSKNEESKKGE